MELLQTATIEKSMTYEWIQPLGPKVIGVIGDLLPWFKDMFAELTAFFEKMSHEVPAAK